MNGDLWSSIKKTKGTNQTLEKILQSILQVKENNKDGKFTNCFLFYGPKKAGKFCIAEQFAKAIEARIFSAKDRENTCWNTFFDSTLNEGKAIIIIKDIENLEKEKKQSKEKDTFLQALKRHQFDNNLLVFATCNQPWNISPELIQSFKQISISLPDESMKTEYLRILLGHLALKLREEDILNIVDSSLNYCFKDFDNLVAFLKLHKVEKEKYFKKMKIRDEETGNLKKMYIPAQKTTPGAVKKNFDDIVKYICFEDINLSYDDFKWGMLGSESTFSIANDEHHLHQFELFETQNTNELDSQDTYKIIAEKLNCVKLPQPPPTTETEEDKKIKKKEKKKVTIFQRSMGIFAQCIAEL